MFRIYSFILQIKVIQKPYWLLVIKFINWQSHSHPYWYIRFQFACETICLKKFKRYMINLWKQSFILMFILIIKAVWDILKMHSRKLTCARSWVYAKKSWNQKLVLNQVKQMISTNKRDYIMTCAKKL